MATADSAYAQRTTVLLGSLASNWAIWKTLLCRLSWVSIFNLEEKKITALLFGCIKIYGAGWFPGCCSCRALLWWCMLVTCHQRRRAPMIHCSNKSFVIHPCLDSSPVWASPAHSCREPWLKTSSVFLCSLGLCCTRVFLFTICGRKE